MIPNAVIHGRQDRDHVSGNSGLAGTINLRLTAIMRVSFQGWGRIRSGNYRATVIDRSILSSQKWCTPRNGAWPLQCRQWPRSFLRLVRVCLIGRLVARCNLSQLYGLGRFDIAPPINAANTAMMITQMTMSAGMKQQKTRNPAAIHLNMIFRREPKGISKSTTATRWAANVALGIGGGWTCRGVAGGSCVP